MIQIVGKTKLYTVPKKTHAVPKKNIQGPPGRYVLGCDPKPNPKP